MYDESEDALPFHQKTARASRVSYSESDDEDRDLHDVYKHIIFELEGALKQNMGSDQTDSAIIAELQDVMMSLEHWKNSVRWCVVGDTSYSGADNESLIRDVLGSLKTSNRTLFDTIEARMDDISENLDSVRDAQREGDLVSR